MRTIIHYLTILCVCYIGVVVAEDADAKNMHDKISFNFQDISIRAALQLIAETGGYKIMVSDAVQGNISLSLDNIACDEALDLILVARGLSMRNLGAMLLIAPSEELTKLEHLAVAARQQSALAEPLYTENARLKFAKVQDILCIIKDPQGGLLSSRGQVLADIRTNTLIITDAKHNIANIRRLVKNLDVQLPQVMIETQIVETIDCLNYTLGLKFKTSTPQVAATDNRLFFDFGGAEGAKLGLTLASLPGGTLLDLELQASESEGRSKTVARPKLLTLDQQAATIETGTEIPYVTTSQQGATPTTIFKKAALRLEVTPKITQANKIALRIFVNNDTPGQVLSGTNEPSINTTSLTTNVCVENGQTIVLGGIFKAVDHSTCTYIPFLHRIPVIGKLFSFRKGGKTRTEVLIFVTPKILQTASCRD